MRKHYRPEDIEISIGGIRLSGFSDAVRIFSYAEPIVWTCSGCRRAINRAEYPTLCLCGGRWLRPWEADTQPDLKTCGRCTFTFLAPGGVCSYCDWRRPDA